MEARLLTIAVCVSAMASLGATYKTENFIVTASTAEVAQQAAEMAETCRKRLAIEWLGEELKPWYYPCPINVRDGALGAGGWTKFTFVPYQGQIHVNNWNMKVQGSLERILDSVIPHEVTHTILATHFRRPLPRWADEGASTLAEHESERRRQLNTLKQVMQSGQTIPLRTLLDMKDYPEDMQKVYTLYAQGYSLSDMLVQQGGRGRFLKFLATAHRKGWDQALQTYYGIRSTSDLEKGWREWVMAGSPDLAPQSTGLLASAPAKSRASTRGQTIRSQSPDDDPFLGNDAYAAALPRAKSSGISAEDSEPTQTASAADPEGETRADSPMDDLVPEPQPRPEAPDILDDDTWELEIVRAEVTEATTSRRGRTPETAVTSNVAPSTRPREDSPPEPWNRRSSLRDPQADVIRHPHRDAVEERLTPRARRKPQPRTQSDFPQER